MPLAIDAHALLMPSRPFAVSRTDGRRRVLRGIGWLVQTVAFAAVMLLLVAGPGFMSDHDNTAGTKRVGFAARGRV